MIYGLGYDFAGFQTNKKKKPEIKGKQES